MIKSILEFFKGRPVKLEAKSHHIPRNPLARKTDWHQNHPNGNHLTHATLIHHPDKLFFEYGKKDIRPLYIEAFSGVVLLCILLPLLVMAIPDYIENADMTFLDLVFLLLPLMVVIYVYRSYKKIHSLRHRTTLATFEFQYNTIYFGKDDNQVPIPTFADIGALQILSELAVADNISTMNGNPEIESFYELNLVDNSGKRTTLIDTLDLNKIKSIANDLSELLKVPIWDLSGLDSSSFDD